MLFRLSNFFGLFLFFIHKMSEFIVDSNWDVNTLVVFIVSEISLDIWNIFGHLVGDVWIISESSLDIWIPFN